MSTRHLITSAITTVLLITSAGAAMKGQAQTPASDARTTKSGFPVKTLSSYDRVNELLAQMTLDEKLAQISCIWFDKKKVIEKDGSFNPEKMKKEFPEGIGCFARPQDTQGMEEDIERSGLNDSTVVRSLNGRTPSNTANLINTIQKWQIEETRLGIPILFHEEGLHGFQGYQATSFPQSIALAATFDTDLVEQVYSVTAREIRVRGAHHVLSPVVDIALDPRWGRIEETYGEDPYLVSRMGVAAVKGFQGDSFPIADDKVVATLKHMTGHGQPEGGMNVGPSQVSDRELYERFFPPFEAAVKEANAASVMASYNEIDGIPSHANSWLLNDVLRDEWGFDGAVVADYFAINELQGRHKIVDSIGEAGALSLRSGVDLELPDGVAFYELKEKIEAGEFDEALVDQAVRRVLELKERANLFATPYADPEAADALTGNQEARDLAEEAARKAPVLLKNKENILPLDVADYKTIAVIGPNAAITVLGGYSDEPRQTVSILDGIKNKVGDKSNVLNAQGVTLTDNRSWWDDEVNLIDEALNRRDIEKAVSVAKNADLVILAIGGDESTSREAWSETHMGDRNDITLIGQQKELVEAVAETGKPIVSVIISGRPLSLANVDDNLDAILYGWILGQETGTAVADLLFGDANPSGKMPVSVPRTVGQIPAFYNHKPTARRGYAFDDASPLYVFGEGMSYTTFDISEPSLSVATIAPNGEASVSVNVTNSGDMAGDEIVQMYIRDRISSVTRPVKELKGFERVSLQPGETKTVEFPITREALQFYNRDMNRVVEPGEFDIMVGNSSQNVKTTTLTVK
ncbi:glycoside hydrolase family 3 N-terminal domain-containing protein [Litorimonas haliclonae]|uniref:glycoside hydrolase family 3 N-terminal domain-containing protein n=1 Tax=Litorimonas haliclonae TaxID=2081977 RepID=UPI0039EE27A2